MTEQLMEIYDKEGNMTNGLIFQKKNNDGYMGVEGDNWYLNDLYPNTIGAYFDEHIARSWYKSDWVDVCNDIFFINEYINLSQRNKIDFRILLCETSCNSPKFDETYNNMTYLGYDYAYAGGSYYSAIYSDIYCRKIAGLSEIQLNQNGLLDSESEMNIFINKRNDLIKNCNDVNMFEKGDFIKYKLYQINFI